MLKKESKFHPQDDVIVAQSLVFCDTTLFGKTGKFLRQIAPNRCQVMIDGNCYTMPESDLEHNNQRKE